MSTYSDRSDCYNEGIEPKQSDDYWLDQGVDTDLGATIPPEVAERLLEYGAFNSEKEFRE
ncbi:hypothetical protein [Thaumasiovibrio subtropicus]|uniref:hypothetical protein n=1 Tax=Thaumasiovibrio subtropicus TaxID=1891207 RepID=UPI000B3625A8|nr:hypothetical protein [Thaumasiovibrio subtropicus]